jgi:hypothetical protein
MNLYEKEHFLLNLGTLCPIIDGVCAEYLTGLLAEVKKEKKKELGKQMKKDTSAD